MRVRELKRWIGPNDHVDLWGSGNKYWPGLQEGPWRTRLLLFSNPRGALT